jgi:glucose/arabinose dehydrogenase
MIRRHHIHVFGFAAIIACLAAQAVYAETFETKEVKLSVETLADGLAYPWAVEVLPDNAIVITERSGGLRIFRAGKLSAPIAGMPDAEVDGQAGLMDIALSPEFGKDRTLFFTTAQEYDGGIGVAVFSTKLSADERQVTGITEVYRMQDPANRAANLGSRIAFARDGTMFVTLGDQFAPKRAQDFRDAHGAIIHINRDGTPAAGNPFLDGEKALPEIWSKGHRNPQGIAFDTRDGALYTAEHGARGGDEINKIEPGKNYGWPVISYGVNYNGTKIGVGTRSAGLEQPLHYWDPSIAPGALLVYRGKMFPEWNGDFLVTALKFQLISRLSRSETGKVEEQEQFLKNEYGRLRDIKEAPDGSLLVVTDSADGALLRISRAEGS